MGRWSQAKRASGPVTLINFITEAVDNTTLLIDLTYQSSVAAGSFAAASFVSNPSAFVAQTVAQVSSRVIRISFLGSIAADTSLTYSGTVPGILTPQTVNH